MRGENGRENVRCAALAPRKCSIHLSHCDSSLDSRAIVRSRGVTRAARMRRFFPLDVNYRELMMR